MRYGMYPMFPKMVDHLKERKGERFALRTFEVSEQDADMMHFRDALNRQTEYVGFTAGTYIKLVDTVEGQVVMSDTAMEKRTNVEAYEKATGHVLIGGLGLGMLLLAIQDKPEVTKITVLEKYQEVYDLVRPQLPLNDKVEVLIADVFDFVPPKDTLYDMIFMDIWSDLCADNWEEYKTLCRRYAHWLNRTNPDCWYGAWRRDTIKALVGGRY